MAALGFNICMPDLPTEFWPEITLGETATFTYDATADVTNNGVVDPIVSATFATMPSGAGELVASSLTVASANGVWLLTVKLSGGVAGRTYTHKLTFTTQGGQVLPILIGQVCNPVLAVPPIAPAPSPFFGTPTNWP